MAQLPALERLAWMDSEIRAGRYPNARKMAEKFEISSKTAQRAIDWMRDRFMAPLEYVPEKKGYRYYEDFRLPVTGLTVTELTHLLAIQKLLEDASRGVLGKQLAGIAGKIQRCLAENFFGGVNPQQVFSLRWTATAPCADETFQCVLRAVVTRHRLSFEYASPYTGEMMTRTVEPHHLVNYQGTWHVLAWCLLREDWRDFVLPRMKQCRVLDDTFRVRDSKEWKDRLERDFGIFRGPTRFQVTVRFLPPLARWAKDQIWHPDQRLENLPTGEVEVTFPASHETEVLGEILRYGSSVELIAPQWLRDKLRDELRRMVEIYTDSTEPQESPRS